MTSSVLSVCQPVEMRAERLLRVVALLQSRGRVTAGELARELEVSTRTIQRDMEALSGAGVPVYATRGAGGGWGLLKGYRRGLTGLTPQELLAVVVGRPPRFLAALGLEDPGEVAILKLLGAVSEGAKAQAEHARQRVHVDLAPWAFVGARERLLPELHRAVWDDRTIAIRYAASPERFKVDPLGLVAKGPTWYLIARSRERYRTYRVSRIQDLEITDRHFERPSDFDLPSHWEDVARGYEESLPTYAVELRVRGDARRRAEWMAGRDKRISEPDAEGWARVHVDLEDEPSAVVAVGMLGAEVVVVEPDGLRQACLRVAQTFLAANAP